MFVADAQVHLWAADTPERPWPTLQPPPVPHRGLASFSAGDLLREMDAAGVHRAVIAPVAWDGARNDLGLDAARTWPDRFAITGRFDASTPDARDRLRSWLHLPGMLGLRLTSDIAATPAADWFWQEAEQAGVPIVISPAAAKLDELDGVAAKHPDLRLAIDHFAAPRDTADEAAFAGLDRLLRLARHPNVAVKASALPAYTKETYPYRSLHTYIRKAYDAFGPRRMFWGSDLTRLPCGYRNAVTMFTEEMPWFSAADLEWIMGRGLCEWLRWPMPAASAAVS